MENDRIAKTVYVGEFAGSLSVGRPRMRYIYTVKDYLKKKRVRCQESKNNGS